MPVFQYIWSIAIGINLALSLLNLYFWIRRRQELSYLIFSVASFLAAMMAFFEMQQSTAGTVEQYASYLYSSTFIVGLLLITIVWFVYVFLKTGRRWLAISITISWSVLLVANMFSPYSIAFNEINGLKNIITPWGEVLHIATGSRNPWSHPADLTSLFILLYFIDTGIRHYKKFSRRRAIIIGGGSTFFMITSAIHTPLVDMAIIDTPYLISIAFLMIILAMGMELGDDIIKASILTKTVAANERRWQSVMENVQLIVVGVDKEGFVDYVNPFFLQLTGYSQADVLGRHWVNHFIPEAHRNKINLIIDDLANKKDIPHGENPVLLKNGQQRTIAWSNVQLYDNDDKVTGILGIGADVTENREAYRQIEELKNRLQEENIYLKEEDHSFSRHQDIIGKSAAIKYALTRVEQVAPTDTTVLIEGETGVGKELFAWAVHESSGRSKQVFINVNCPAIPPNLIESELFGHEKGSFTGAHIQRKGRFELADGGTLFLDEIGELPLDVQSKLLRVLEAGEFERIGNSKTHKTNVRVIAATNRILKNEVSAGRFREDLYYRINTYPISIPPLRKRKEDIPLLIELFVDRFGRKLGKTIQKIPKESLQKLMEYTWPGNVRELRNVIESAVIGSHAEKLIISSDTQSKLVNGSNKVIKEDEILSMEQMERHHIIKILNQCNWRISGDKGAARLLDMHPNTLRNRMLKLNIEK